MLVIGLCGAGGRGGLGFIDGGEWGGTDGMVEQVCDESMKYQILQGCTAMVRMGDTIGDAACAGDGGGSFGLPAGG